MSVCFLFSFSNFFFFRASRCETVVSFPKAQRRHAQYLHRSGNLTITTYKKLQKSAKRKNNFCNNTRIIQ